MKKIQESYRNDHLNATYKKTQELEKRDRYKYPPPTPPPPKKREVGPYVKIPLNFLCFEPIQENFIGLLAAIPLIK